MEFKNVLKGRGYVFVSTGNKLWIPSTLINIRLDWGRSPENLPTNMKEKTYKTGDVHADPTACEQL